MKPPTHKQQLKSLQTAWRERTGKKMPPDVSLLPLNEIHKRLAVQPTLEQVEAAKRDLYGESMVYFDQHKFH